MLGGEGNVFDSGEKYGRIYGAMLLKLVLAMI